MYFPQGNFSDVGGWGEYRQSSPPHRKDCFEQLSTTGGWVGGWLGVPPPWTLPPPTLKGALHTHHTAQCLFLVLLLCSRCPRGYCGHCSRRCSVVCIIIIIVAQLLLVLLRCCASGSWHGGRGCCCGRLASFSCVIWFPRRYITGHRKNRENGVGGPGRVGSKGK